MMLFTIAWIATAVLAILKLAGIAAIGWWIVFTPILALGAVFLGLLLIAFIILVNQ